MKAVLPFLVQQDHGDSHVFKNDHSDIIMVIAVLPLLYHYYHYIINISLVLPYYHYISIASI